MKKKQITESLMRMEVNPMENARKCNNVFFFLHPFLNSCVFHPCILLVAVF